MAITRNKEHSYRVILSEAGLRSTVFVWAHDGDQAVRRARKVIPWASKVLSIAERCRGRIPDTGAQGPRGLTRPCTRWTTSGYCHSHQPTSYTETP